MYLADINVLLALVFEAHVHHPTAVEWFNTVPDESCFVCRVTQSGFLRLASNPALFGDEALSLSDAWACYDTLMSDTRMEFEAEPLGLDHMWRRLTTAKTYSPKVWTDAYLAAFAITGSLTLVTLDKAVASIPDLDAQVLGA
jgi:toxin-antitoxin system PIN domain toxin